MRVDLHPAYVLHRRPYRDTSALVDVFSAEHGRLTLVARGVRAPKSRLRGILQPFRPLLLSWSLKADLGTLTGAEPNGPVPVVPPAGLASAFYLNELVLRLIQRHDPQPALFRHYLDTLQRIHDPLQERAALRLFERHLLEELGYGLMLEYDAASGAPVQADTLYCYHLESGPVATPQPPPSALTVSGRTLLDLARGVLTDEHSLREAKRLMRAALGLYLGNKPLHSRTLYRALRAGGENNGCDTITRGD